MTLTLDPTDARTVKAIDIAAGAGQWLKCRTRDGHKAYGIPSQRSGGVYHLANCHECTCWDFQHRRQACKHVLAVRLHVELVKASQARSERKLKAA